jgi:ATP-dependent DNA helicase RecG
VAPTAFASSSALPDAALRAAEPPHYPRVTRWLGALEVSPPKAAAAAERLGLRCAGDLLEHLPRDRAETRTVGDLVPGETATVVVDVRSITSRSVRRRGMRPARRGDLADATGS